jgi:acyl-CoA synthetase (AMP-forming)/AMP-acid ligase II
LSGQLRSAGLKPGDSVAIVLPNSLEFLVVFLALTHARLVAAPLNPAHKPDEIRFFVGDAQARAVVAERANIAGRLAATGQSRARRDRADRALTLAVSWSCRNCRKGRAPASTLRTRTMTR